MKNKVKIVGAGLAGSEAAYFLASHGVNVTLYDIKPARTTPAHHSEKFGELVCSNSLKSNDIYGNACGLLKEELRMLGSMVIAAADETRVAAGNALAVDREAFAQKITDKLKGEKNIDIFCEEITDIDFDEYTVVASGPLTTPPLEEKIKSVTGGNLFFFDF